MTSTFTPRGTKSLSGQITTFICDVEIGEKEAATTLNLILKIDLRSFSTQYGQSRR